MNEEQTDEAIRAVQKDIETLKEDVHSIAESVDMIKGQVALLNKATNPVYVLFAAFLFAVATHGLVVKSLTEPTAITLYLLGVLVLQHESVNKFARTIFRVRERDTDRADRAEGDTP